MRRATNQNAWSLLLLLLLVVVIPTVFVLWFMLRAVENERLAVRSRLVDVYQDRALEITSDLVKRFEEKLDLEAQGIGQMTAGEAFGHLVQTGACHGAVILDERGRVLYPGEMAVEGKTSTPLMEAWREMERLEYEQRDPVAAAQAYAAWGQVRLEQWGEVSSYARALMAQARCLEKAGDRDAALAILKTIAADAYREARDDNGRWLGLNAQLRLLQLVPKAEWASHGLAAEPLLDALQSYAPPPMPAGQRLFLLRALAELVPANYPTLAAEETAAAYVESEQPAAGASYLERTTIPDVYHIVRTASDGRQFVLLFNWKRLCPEMSNAFEPSLRGRASVAAFPPEVPAEQAPLLTMGTTKGPLKDWKVCLYLKGHDPFEEAAERRVAVYLWTGILVVVSMAVLALMAARRVVQQVRLTRLRNELISTVSHELKTPLASMRVLVDTLLEERCRDGQQQHEYLELIAKENKRLSHLIDNFLTFSRMERNKQVFEYEPIDIKGLVDAAVEAAGARFREPGCRLEVDVADDLPCVEGDRDALTTALLNLLDNAYKYSKEERHIQVKAFRDGKAVCFEVRDNGIGMSRRARRKAFERFYQADRSLSREVGGCGLGLSIVQFIVKAHGGTINVESELGNGSAFTVRLPVDEGGSNGA